MGYASETCSGRPIRPCNKLDDEKIKLTEGMHAMHESGYVHDLQGKR